MVKAASGFTAELPGFDLATLIQMTCARRERLVICVRSYDEEGFLYTADGRIVHATAGELRGEEAVLRIMAWNDGEFSLSSRPFPQRNTIDCSVEGLLLRAAQESDDALREVRPVESLLLEPASPFGARAQPAVSAPGTRADLRATMPGSRAQQRASTPSSRGAPRASTPGGQAGRPSIPPPLPSHLQRPLAEAEPVSGAALLASVRVDAHGEVIGAFGHREMLAPLVAYVAHMASRISAELGLAPFDALHAELSGLRVTVFDEDGEKIGVMMQPSREARELRQRFGV